MKPAPIDHERFECPPETRPGDLRPCRGGLAGVLAPHFLAPVAAVTAHPDHERRHAMSEGHMREPPRDGIAEYALGPAAAAPGVGFVHATLNHDFPGLEPLPDRRQSEFIEPAESREISRLKVAWSMSRSFGWAV